MRERMLYYPHAYLHSGPSSSIVISGPYIQSVNNSTGDIIATADEQYTVKSGPVRCSAVDTKWKLLVTAADDKKLRVWDLSDGLKILSERELPKKPTEVRITRDSEAILVSDKFGDVFRYDMTLIPQESATSRAQDRGRSALASHENLAGGTLILGHASLLPTFVLSPDEKYIITADRDEHIRVSWFPQGYVIERYCLGHTKFVSALHIPAFSPHSLISGGGDPYLQFWDWMSGTQQTRLPVLDAIRPFLKVRPPKGRPWSSASEGEGEGEGAGDEKPGRKKGKGKRKKGKDQSEVADEVDGETRDDEGVEDVAMESAPTVVGDFGIQDQLSSHSSEDDSPVLVINRIETTIMSDGSKWVLFHAVGATALCYIRHPDDWPVRSEPLPILNFDLGKPVIDFLSIAGGKFWVLTDGQWEDPSDPSSTVSKPGVRQVQWVEGLSGWKIVEVSDEPLLLKSLNSICQRPAALAELKTADIYSQLSSMPKNVDPEHDPMVRDDLKTLDTSTLGKEIAGTAGGKGKGKARSPLTQREVARLRSKKALIESIREKTAGKGATHEAVEDERETKKVKPQSREEKKEVIMDES